MNVREPRRVPRSLAPLPKSRNSEPRPRCCQNPETPSRVCKARASRKRIKLQFAHNAVVDVYELQDYDQKMARSEDAHGCQMSRQTLKISIFCGSLVVREGNAESGCQQTTKTHRPQRFFGRPAALPTLTRQTCLSEKDINPPLSIFRHPFPASTHSLSSLFRRDKTT